MSDSQSPPLTPARSALRGAIPGLILVVIGGAIVLWSNPRSQLEVDEQSEYSHIRIRRRGDFRQMLFVRDNGVEALQSGFNVDAPHELTSPYAQAMFASYLFRPQPERVLIVGLGGGSMVRFLQHHEPQLGVDVVEIDPVVVRLADKYFEARSSEHVNIMTTDGFDYLETTTEHYDVIYFDAFLKPSEETDATGVPRKLKTIAFYETVQSKLQPEGVVVFNLNPHADTDEDIQTIRDAFAQTTVFDCVRGTNVIAVSSTSTKLVDPEELKQQAADLDRRFDASFSFREILDKRRQ